MKPFPIPWRKILLWGITPAVILFPLRSSSSPPTDSPQMRKIGNVAYYQGPDQDDERHRLDIYVPPNDKNFPVLFFVHGGGWIEGNKNHFGVYAALARCFTRCGIGVVCPNYRLSPKVRHPEHVRDVARAFAWTYRNIAKYGGKPGEIFVGGHSAGGHLSALLASDETYLKEQGLSLRNIQGAIPVSGLFTIPKGRFFETAFGPDLEVRKNASPIQHVHPGQPPFLILLADNDFPTCDRPQAEAFYNQLRKNQVPARLMEIPQRNHLSILVNAVNSTDIVTRSMLNFIMTRVALNRLQEQGGGGVEILGDFIGRYASP